MWESTQFPHLFVLSIPYHSGRDIPIGTKKSILDQLEDDIFEWEQLLDDSEDEDDKSGDDLE